MLHSLARIAVRLDIDNIANRVMEGFYRNGRSVRSRFSRRFQILAFHKVSPDPHPYFEPVHPIIFERYAEFLHRNYRVMHLDELVVRSRHGDIPDRAVAITFDDGYRDNYENAFPILKKYELPATIFVATGAIGTGETLWHDRIFDAFRHTSASHLHLKGIAVNELVLDNSESRHHALKLTLDHAKKLYGISRLEFVEEVEQALTPNRPPQQEDRMLTWDQIGEMHRAGIRFGSHTVTHPILSRVPQEELTRELFESKRQLSKQLGAPVESFAYPNGRASDYNSTVKDALRECGYTFAVTCEPGYNCAQADPFELKRGAPWQSDIELFRANFFLQRHGLVNVRH
jgi:peptidoglycan/xylan/chitin deacetylase (PgdA/CDA1 family)